MRLVKQVGKHHLPRIVADEAQALLRRFPSTQLCDPCVFEDAA